MMDPKIEVAGSAGWVADVLLVLTGVGDGDYNARLETSQTEDHPLTMLYDGINEMIASLATAQERQLNYARELEEKLQMIEHQRAAIRELSTPIIEVWDGILCLPVVGVMDTTRSAEMMDSLLNAIVVKEARCAIIDITGIQVMDTATSEHFIRTARAVRLLGTECILTGINSTIAVTMQTMGVDIKDVMTLRSLRHALQHLLASKHMVLPGQ
ncbi:MAG TPA: STAS domain-containing protein [Labilithrix sp.]|jgi:rsbT co-antagonist protein RsbR|nr:STAS domain-containing protein [Labilithrix sp.]